MAAVLRDIGRTPESRVKWALAFRSLDLSRLSERDRQRAWTMLLTWQGGQPNHGARPAKDGVPSAQRALREAIVALANGQPVVVYGDEDEPQQWTLWPPQRRRPGARRSGLITKSLRQGQRVRASGVVFALVDDLNAI